MTLVSAIFVEVFGLIFRLKFFTKNNVMVVFLLFLLFQLSMVRVILIGHAVLSRLRPILRHFSFTCFLQTGFAFMMSAFISKSSSATSMGFSIFIVGFLTQARFHAKLLDNLYILTYVVVLLVKILNLL